jgi:hypothetical protein
MSTKRTDSAKMADEALSICLLSGFDVDKMNNTPFPAHFSADEREARAALARIIRDQMTGYSAELLAMAVDPFTPSAWPHMRPTRKIKFLNQGRQSTLMIEKQVVDYIRHVRFDSEKGQNQKFYIMSAVAEFKKRGIKLAKSRVHEIWSEYEKMLKRAKEAGSKN